MQSAYVEQIPAGAEPSTSPPVLKITPGAGPRVQPPPAGLYVQVASVVGQQQALQAGLELTQRLGANRPAFIRGVGALVDGRPEIRMFAGPFVDSAAAKRFCALALPDQECAQKIFAATPRTSLPARGTGCPTSAGPPGKGAEFE